MDNYVDSKYVKDSLITTSNEDTSKVSSNSEADASELL